jgi:purine-binding chemotaxis protein CheW
MPEIVDHDLKEEETQKGKYLTFKLGEEQYGIKIKYVLEIVGIQEITQVPEMPDYIKGIINLRGQIIPVMDVRIRFGKPPKAYNGRTCVIVVSVGGNTVGLIVDTVSEVYTVREEKIVLPPDLNYGNNSRFIQGIYKEKDQVKLLIDCKRVLDL